MLRSIKSDAALFTQPAASMKTTKTTDVVEDRPGTDSTTLPVPPAASPAAPPDNEAPASSQALNDLTGSSIFIPPTSKPSEEELPDRTDVA